MEKETVETLKVTKKAPASENYPEISIRDFLDFLRTAYQVQDTVENVLISNGMTETVDWLKLKENKLVKSKTQSSSAAAINNPSSDFNDSSIKADLTRRKSDTNTTITNSNESDPMKRKLSEILSEGLLDSVLPHLLPSSSNNSSRHSSVVKVNSEKTISSVSTSLKRNNNAAAASSSKTNALLANKIDSEVEIHVCDEVKNMKKDFTCNQALLVSKMGYFAEVTTGQRLEDMDISVHCDIGIFEWLMKWVKKDSALLPEDYPELDPQTVIPILVSAAFLQMEPLQNDCLLYCHEHMNEILRTSTNLSCLNDSILTRLAAMYTNTEVELIKDRKDKIQSRIFTKLIQSLIEIEPESVRGHWNSLAKVYRCSKCHQIISSSPFIAALIPCIPPCMQLQCDGSVKSQHCRDSSWNINDYILKLSKAFKSWRKVYWRLWGDAHFLYCSVCKRYFPAHQIGWCRFHPDPPQYFTLDAQKAPLPVGRYPCCGERAYRFQLLHDYSGCQFKDHTVATKDVRDSAVLGMLENYRGLIEEEPPQLMFPERLTRLVARESSSTTGGNGNDCKKLVCKENFWWEGFQIVPARPKLGLLSVFTNRNNNNNNSMMNSNNSGALSCNSFSPRQHHGASLNQDSDEEDGCNSSESSSSSSDGTSSSSSDGSDDEALPESNLPVQAKHHHLANNNNSKINNNKRKTVNNNNRKIEGRLWQHNLSARSNQDIQRSYEENTIKEMVSVLNRRTVGEVGSAAAGPHQKNRGAGGFSRNVTPVGGLWVRLEAEWKETNQIQTNNPQKMRSIFTGKVRPNKCPNK